MIARECRGKGQLELIIITGPTAVGKTAVAVELAKRLGTEIISADSMQVYKHLSIGTGKPTIEELQGVPYHLIDHVNPDYQYNLGDFIAEATSLIHHLHEQEKLPIVCGGTCLYVKGLLYGIFDAASRDNNLRKELSTRCVSEGLASLYSELQRVDPAASQRISPNDRQRIIRALEVFYVTGRPISEWQQQFSGHPRYRAALFILNLPREVLYDRINKRVDVMIKRGLLDEIKQYVSAGFSLENPVFRALGYQEMLEHIRGNLSLEEAVEAMKKKTRHFAKRQLTWFRSMTDAEWIDALDKSPHAIVEEILTCLKKFST